MSSATGPPKPTAVSCWCIKTRKGGDGHQPVCPRQRQAYRYHENRGLKQALNKYGFDAAFGGARRDEEKSRAKERIYSFRDRFHRWDPKNQRPELWHNYNGQINKGESIRVFPLSNWTELDIWQYIYLENIEIVPLYLAAERPVLERDGMLMMIDDDRIDLQPGEVIENGWCVSVPSAAGR